MDGRKHPGPHEVFLQGHSVGRFEGKELVIETTNFPFSPDGLDDHIHVPSSAAKKLTERWRKVAPDKLDVTFTQEDPIFLKKPWTWTWHYEKRPQPPLTNFECDPEGAFMQMKVATPSKYRRIETIHQTGGRDAETRFLQDATGPGRAVADAAGGGARRPAQDYRRPADQHSSHQRHGHRPPARRCRQRRRTAGQNRRLHGDGSAHRRGAGRDRARHRSGLHQERAEHPRRKDPFDINQHAAALYAPNRNWGAPVEIALWDLLGKATDQPLYKLWGGLRDRVLPYAAMWGIGTPEDRAEIAARLKADGWRAIKLRSGFTTLKDDVRLVELVRKAVGDDFYILTDGNKAPGNADAAGEDPTLWNFKRAVDTAREYERLNVYWFEEPLPRYDYRRLKEINRLVAMPMAGGEGNWSVHEFKDMLDNECFDILMPEIINLGPQMSRTIGTLAGAYNKQVSPHSAPFSAG